MRAAVVGGVAYHAGKKGQQNAYEEEDQDARIAELEAQQQQPAPPVQAAPAGGMSQSVVEQLRQLGQLKDDGILTQEEFDAQKQKLLQGA